MDSIPVDKVLKKMRLDLQVSRYTRCVPNAWRPIFCGSAFLKNGLAFLQELDEVGMTLVDWQRGNFHCELIQHPENLLNHTINFILQILCLASQNIVLVLD